MVPSEPPEESLFSRILVVGALVALLVILGICVYVIYGYVSAGSGDSGVVTPTPVPTATPAPSRMATPVPTPTSTATPTDPFGQFPSVTPTPTPVYQNDVQVTQGLKVVARGVGIWEQYIVYDEWMELGPNAYKVHLYNINTRKDDVIAQGNVRSYGCIGSGKVGLLYGDSNKIMLYDIAGGQQQQVSPVNNIPRAYPSIYGNQLVFTGNEGNRNPQTGMLDIFGLYDYEFATGNINLLVHNIPEPNEPRGDGQYIVWWDVTGGGNIVLLDTKSIKSKNVSPEGAVSNHPRISGNTVVYHSVVGGIDHIFSYDITTGQTRQITSLGMQYSADVSGSRIVYDNDVDGKCDIWMFDRSTMQERQLTDEPHDQMYPQIYGNNVVYLDNRNYAANDNQWDLYVLSI